MTKSFRFSLLICLGIIQTGWAGKIVKPWRSTTAIVKSGEIFDVWFDADGGQTVSSVELEGPYNTVSCSKSIATGDWEYDQMSGNRYDTFITVTVPADAPADRYDLVLKTTTGDEISYGGVKVVKAFKDNYYIMHMSDGHIYQANYDEDVLLARKSTMIDIANIMDVQLIIETGDNMYNVRNHPDREVTYFQGNATFGTKGMADASAATFLLPGDHDGYAGNDWVKTNDQVNADFFNDYWGVQYSRFKYGNGRFMLFNNAWNVSTSAAKSHAYQITDAVNWLGHEGSNGSFFVSAGHCYDKMHEFIDDAEPLDLVLAGDKHHVRTDNPWPFDDGSADVAYIAGSIRDHFEFNLFKVNNAGGTFTTPAGMTAVASALSSGDQNTRSTWVPNMELSYADANDGSVSDNSATIINRYDFPIEGALIRFIMPLGQTYDVSAGTIEQAFDGDTVHVVDVKIDLSADSATAVDIFAAGMASNRASFVSWDAPSELDPGETASVRITMKNTGLDAWTAGAGQMLGSQDPADNTIWGLSRVALPGAVATNQNAVFTLNITAPSNPGTYDFRWQMIDEAGDNTGWFGSKTPSTAIKVGSLPPVVNFIAPSGDVSLTTGDDLYVNVGATDPDGSSIRVRLYLDGVELSRSEGLAPYEWNGTGQDDPELRNFQQGAYTLTAKATDGQNETSEASITVTVGPGQVPGNNLIQNPSFETGDNTGWTFSTPAATSVTTNSAADGTYSVALALTTAGTVSPVRQIIEVEPNADYTFTYSAKVPSSGITGSLTARLTVNGVKLKSSTPASSPTSGWERKTILFNSGAATSITLDVYADSGFSGTVYIDDFSLTAQVDPSAYEIWAEANRVTGLPHDDDDDDGQSNLLEYALDGVPDDARNSGTAPSVKIVDGEPVFCHLYRNDDAELDYVVHLCTNLVDGAWFTSGVAAFRPENSGALFDEVTNRISIASDAVLFRLDVSRP